MQARRSANALGTVTWQLNEIWPTGGPRGCLCSHKQMASYETLFVLVQISQTSLEEEEGGKTSTEIGTERNMTS